MPFLPTKLVGKTTSHDLGGGPCVGHVHMTCVISSSILHDLEHPESFIIQGVDREIDQS